MVTLKTHRAIFVFYRDPSLNFGFSVIEIIHVTVRIGDPPADSVTINTKHDDHTENTVVQCTTTDIHTRCIYLFNLNKLSDSYFCSS